MSLCALHAGGSVGKGVLRVLCCLAVALSVCLLPQTAFAQQSWSVGGLAGTGIPFGIGGLRVSVPGTPTVTIDFDIARVGPDTGLGRVFVADFRWMRHDRSANGNGRYWIFGAAFADKTSTTTLVYPGHQVERLTMRRGLVIPRLGYGWDHVAHNGLRAGLDLTTGAAGEEAGMMLGTVFVTWGPPRR